MSVSEREHSLTVNRLEDGRGICWDTDTDLLMKITGNAHSI